MRSPISAATLLCLFAFAPNAHAEDTCRSILVYASRDEQLSDYDFASARDTYDTYCENGTIIEGKNISAVANVIVESVPLGLSYGDGSSSSKMRQFCKNFSLLQQTKINTHSVSSLVNGLSVAAWQQCVALHLQGVSFKPNINDTQFSVEIQRTSGAPLRIEGVTYDRNLLTCSLPPTTPGGTVVAATPSTIADVENENILTITCTRNAQPSGDTVIYPKADFSIATN